MVEGEGGGEGGVVGRGGGGELMVAVDVGCGDGLGGRGWEGLRAGDGVRLRRRRPVAVHSAGRQGWRVRLRHAADVRSGVGVGRTRLEVLWEG